MLESDHIDLSVTVVEQKAAGRCYIYCIEGLSEFSQFCHRFAYVEFGDKDSAETALALDDSLFRGRLIKV